MEWLKDRNSKGWRILASLSVLTGFVGFYKLGKSTGREKAVKAAAEHIYGVGGDYRNRSAKAIQDDLGFWV